MCRHKTWKEYLKTKEKGTSDLFGDIILLAHIWTKSLYCT